MGTQGIKTDTKNADFISFSIIVLWHLVMFCFQNSQHPATSINASCCIQYCVDVFSAGAMLVVLNRAPKGKLSIVLKAPVEASMLFLTGSTKMNFPPKTSPSIEVK